MVRVNVIASEEMELDSVSLQPGDVIAHFDVATQEAAEQLQVLMLSGRAVLDPQTEED